MNIKGIHKTSLIDFPGKISSVLFSGGCNLKCRYCHNPDLVCRNCELKGFSNEEAIGIIRKRKGLIDGVSLSGGEPTLSRNLESFIRTVKQMSLSVKIDTNGLNPSVIENLLSHDLLDYVAVDVKTSPEKYELLTERPVDFSLIKRTLSMLKESGVDYEIRTTCIPYYVTLEDFQSIRREIGFVRRYYLQQFVNRVTIDEALKDCEPYSLKVLEGFKRYVLGFSELCEIRGI